MSQPSIEDLDRRVEYLELIEGIRQECPPGKRWDTATQRCKDLDPLPPAPTGGGAAEIVPIISATSSGVDGTNIPDNVFDNNPATRFSVKGLGSWISLDLGAVQEVAQIQFTWYMQPLEVRTNVVSVEFSDQPNATPAATSTTDHTNHGQAVSVAGPFDPPKQVRSIVVKLTSTTESRQWFSITDVKITGKVLTQVGPEPPKPVPVPPPVPGPETGLLVDVFGVAKIYQDAAPPVNNWSFTDVGDSRFFEEKPKVVSGTGKDAWLTYPKLDQGRIEVLPEAGIDPDKDVDTYHYEKVIAKGYLRKPRNSPDGKGDWGDIEMTAAYRNVVPGSGSFESHAEMVRGGGRQSTNSNKAGKDGAVEISCAAMSYHNGVYPPPGSDRAKFEKDTKHTAGYTAHDPEFKAVFSKNKIDQKAGYVHKFVAYRVPNSGILGGFAMKLESYASVDGLEGKKFVLLGEYLDDHKWGPTRGGPPTAKSCGCPDEYPVHSMDVLCPGWRIDFMKSFEFSKLSIRSIDPSKKLI